MWPRMQLVAYLFLLFLASSSLLLTEWLGIERHLDEERQRDQKPRQVDTEHLKPVFVITV